MTSSSDNTYETTRDDCLEWFSILNEELFDNKLTPIVDIDIRWRRGAWAYYEYVTDTRKNDYAKLRLCMNKRYTNKKFFVEVLAHELVHHYQFLYNERDVNHGPTFICWVDKFNTKGINLVKSYGDENDEGDEN
jgi:hypothetical protein